MKNRLIVLSTYASAINTLAALRQKNDYNDFNNIIVLWSTVENNQLHLDFIKNFNEFTQGYLLHRAIDESDCFKVIEKIGIKNFDEILTPYHWPYISFMSTGITIKKIIIVDEGISSYSVYSDPILHNLDVTFYLINPNILFKHNKNVNHQIIQLNKDIIIDILSAIPFSMKILPNSVIFIAPLSLNHPINLKNILIINSLIKLNYNIYYKIHPRDKLENHQNILHHIIDDKKCFFINNSLSYPVEILLYHNSDKIKFLIGEQTYILFTSYDLFNIPSFTLLTHTELTDNTLWGQMSVLKNLPLLSDFLNSNQDPHTFYKQTINSLNIYRECFDILDCKILDQNREIEHKNNEINNKNLEILEINNKILDQNRKIEHQNNEINSKNLKILEISNQELLPNTSYKKIKKLKSFKRKLTRLTIVLAVVTILLIFYII